MPNREEVSKDRQLQILNTMEKKYRVKVDHTGRCMGFSYKRGVETILPESVIAAIGEENMKVIGEPVAETPGQSTQPEPETKEVKSFFDKMVRSGDSTTK